jgi:hypothetical protein
VFVGYGKDNNWTDKCGL